MRQKLVGLLILLVGITMTAAVAGAKEIERRVPIIDDGTSMLPVGRVYGVNAAMQGTDTFYYGGTVISGGDTLAAAPSAAGWANRKMWSWSPSGFNGTPHSGLNMDGWRGVDRTDQVEDYMHVASSTSTDPYYNIGDCVIAGYKSLFCGMTNQQCVDLYFSDVSGTGYANDMYQIVVTPTYAYNADDTITLAYAYHNETEAGHDYSYVILQSYDSDAATWTDYYTLGTYDDVVNGTDSIDVASYMAGLSPPVNFRIAFKFDSDDGYSDEDGHYPTECGGLEIDNYVLTINSTPVESEDFESVADGSLPTGWEHYYAGCGDYAHVTHVNDLPVLLSQDVCYTWIGPSWCEMADSVLVFYDENNLSYAHPLRQDNYAYSPVIDFSAHPGLPGKLFSCERFGYSPLVMYIFFYYECRYAPASESGGWSGWLSDGYVYYTSETAACRPLTYDVSTLIPPTAEKAQIAYGVINLCDEDPWGYGDCSYTCNATPYFDNMSFGLYGSDVAPYISMRELDYFQDQFSEDGTLNPASTADTRIASYLGDLNPPVFGDTMVCRGGADDMQVWLTFRMAKVSPLQPTTNAFFTTWFPTATTGAWQEARMDTAAITALSGTETRSVPGIWMTCFHESDPIRLANGLAEGTEILPNNLFVPGTRVEYFLKARYTGSSYWFLLPDTTGGVSEEFEILPMMRDVGEGGVEWPCLIVADHFGQRGNWGLRNSDRIAQHLAANDYEYDMFNKLGPTSDLRNGIARWAANTGQIGGPGTYKYNWGPGATPEQLRGYTHCMLNAGSQYYHSMYEQDVDLINSWLVSYSCYDFPRFFWLSGNAAARWLHNQSTASRTFLNSVLGTQYVTSNYASNTNDYTYCLPIRGLAGSLPDTTLFVARSNGCLNTFNCITSINTGIKERKFDSSATARYAAVSNNVATNDGTHYKSLVEGYDNCFVRTDGSLGYPACGNDNVLTGWFASVLGWGNYAPNLLCNECDPYIPYPPYCTVQWENLVNDDKAFVCPTASSETSSIHVVVRNRFGRPLSLPVTATFNSSCDMKLCREVYAWSDHSGEATLVIPAGLDRSDQTECCSIRTRVTCFQMPLFDDTRLWLSPDLNADGTVDALDAAILSSDISTSACRSDFNCDGLVDSLDSAIFGCHVGHTCTGVVGIDKGLTGVPLVTAMAQNYPNPFNPVTEIKFSLAKPGRVVVRIYDIVGRPVRTLIDSWRESGVYSVLWDGRADDGVALPSGVYFCSIKAGDFAASRKMVMLR
ncbi:MAG: T9SS type A sorting domain-containing protein [Candidatus Eisenbacteria bacterium]|nr:T9SS type A sorting domain-containing protein [Candidatus Eisenbacteria bacterium]